MRQPQRFVILTHDHPVLHWDLMLDTGEALRTWRLESEPRIGVETRAIALPDHRRMYLDYEGPVSGNRGTVEQWDTGTYSGLDVSASRLRFAVDGDRVQGMVDLWRSIVEDDWVFFIRESLVET